MKNNGEMEGPKYKKEKRKRKEKKFKERKCGM